MFTFWMMLRLVSGMEELLYDFPQWLHPPLTKARFSTSLPRFFIFCFF